MKPLIRHRGQVLKPHRLVVAVVLIGVLDRLVGALNVEHTG